MILLNNQLINVTRFPDKTSQVWKLENVSQAENTIEWKWEGEDEVFHITQLVELLYQITPSKIYLIVPYLPYARQDKQITNETTFAGRCFVRWLNGLPLNKVTVFDPHSSLANTILNVDIRMPDIDKLAKDYDYVVFPDAGAAERYKTTKPTIVGHKVRNQETGRIERYEVDIPNQFQSTKILVVDDICTGGATFRILGQSLQNSNCDRQVDLYFSHNDCKDESVVNELLTVYDNIITTNSRYHFVGDKIKTILDWRNV